MIINWIQANEQILTLGLIALLVIIIVLLLLFRKPKQSNKIKKEIRDSRQQLRNLYTKYQKEFYDINLKIDKFLEVIENGKS